MECWNIVIYQVSNMIVYNRFNLHKERSLHSFFNWTYLKKEQFVCVCVYVYDIIVIVVLFLKFRHLTDCYSPFVNLIINPIISNPINILIVFIYFIVVYIFYLFFFGYYYLFFLYMYSFPNLPIFSYPFLNCIDFISLTFLYQGTAVSWFAFLYCWFKECFLVMNVVIIHVWFCVAFGQLYFIHTYGLWLGYLLNGLFRILYCVVYTVLRILMTWFIL